MQLVLLFSAVIAEEFFVKEIRGEYYQEGIFCNNKL